MNYFNKLPKKLMEKLAGDLDELLETHEGALLALQLLENLPEQVKVSLVANLSMIHTEEVAKFMNLVEQEYPGEDTGAVAQRSLKKLKLAGVEIDKNKMAPIEDSIHNFYLGSISRTRLKGTVNLVLLFLNRSNPQTLDAYFFTLSFCELGIKEFFYVREISYEQAGTIIQDETYQQLSFSQSLKLLDLAYQLNTEWDSLPALGLFIYQPLLKQAETLTEQIEYDFYPILSQELNPTILINGFCLAMRTEDQELMDYLTQNCDSSLPQVGLLLFNEVIQVEELEEKEENHVIEVTNRLIVEEDDGLYELYWRITLEYLADNRLTITNIQQLPDKNIIHWDWLEENLSAKKATTAYFMHQPHAVRLFIESLDGMELFQDGDDVDFYKWWDLDTILQKGICLKNGVTADLFLSEEELVIMTDDEEKLNQVKEFFEANLNQELEMLEVEVPIEVIYKIFDENNLSFNQMIDQWELTGINRKEQLSLWLTTKLTDLDGMTPLEASSSSEGAKLLWALVKRIYQESKISPSSIVDYHSLLKAVGWGKKINKNS